LLPLRFPRLWSALGWLLVIGVVIGSLLPGQSIRLVTIDDKLLHAGTYMVLMLWFSGLYRPGLYVAIAAALCALGVALDLLQGLTRTRSFDWYDVAANLAGVLVGCALAFAVVGGWCERIERRLLS
jgi:VanZ family protein